MSPAPSPKDQSQSALALAALALCVISFFYFQDEQAKEKDPGTLGDPLGNSPGPEHIAGPVVVIDAGHGGMDGGAHMGDLIEKGLTLDVAKRLERELKRMGINVAQTRTSDLLVPLAARTAVANRYPDALFVSIHFNTSSAREVAGVETYHTAPKSLPAIAEIKRRFGIAPEMRLRDDRNRLLAEEVQRGIVSLAGSVDRGVKNKSLLVTREALGPAVLVECAYLTNSEELARVQSSQFRERLAQGIARGVRDYIGNAEQSGDRLYGLVLEETGPAEVVQGSQSRNEGSKGQSGAISSL